MTNIFLIIITILYTLMGINFFLFALFGLPWDSYVQDKVDKIFDIIRVITIYIAALLYIFIILLIVTR